MHSTYQKRVQKVVDDLPMKLRFRMFLDNIANNINDPVVLHTNNAEEQIDWAKMTDRFNALSFLYSFKRCMQAQSLAIDYNKLFNLALKSHVERIQITLKLVSLIRDLNSKDKDPYISQMCLKVEETYKEEGRMIEELFNKSKDEIEAFRNSDSLLEFANKLIIKLENEFGIEHPLKKYLVG